MAFAIWCAMASEPRPAIDMAHLGTYTQGDRGLELELLTMFLPSAQGYIDAMADSLDEAQAKAWSTAAHSLKGVALGVGAWEIAELAKAAETLHDNAQAVRHDAVREVQAALERVRSFVAELN